VLNRGATVLSPSYSAMRRIAREVGADSDIVTVPAVVGVVRDGETHLLRASGPGAVLDFARTPLLSGRSKLLLARAGIDAWRARRKTGYDTRELRAELDTETVAQYCDRRLNAEIRDRLVEPLLGGLFLTDAKDLSVADLFFSFTKILGSGILGYRGGIDFFARALAERLDVRTDAPVTSVEDRPGGAHVRWTQDGVEHEEHVDGVVVSVAAPVVPTIYPELDPAVQEILLEGLQRANFIGFRFALSERPESDALLVVIPSGELDGLATVTFEHNLGPGTAPAGKGVVGVLVYHEWATPRMHLSDEELIEEVLPELERVVPGISETIEFAAVSRWTPGALRTVQGTHRLIAELHDRLDPSARVQLAGDYLGVPSINGSIVSGEAAGDRLARTIGTGAGSRPNGGGAGALID
jgi:oxygen-dependent protoporphyrinogen oxidase